MKAIGLFGFTIYFAFLGWLWFRDWRMGVISRFPALSTIYADKRPRLFKVWTVVHGTIGIILFGLLILAWWALFTGNLH